MNRMRAVLLLAPGFEEVEAVTPIDFLRRADIEVTVLSVKAEGGLEVSSARQLRLLADQEIGNYTDTPEALVLPGGMPGAKNLSESREVAGLIQRVQEAGGIIAAICASPALVLAPLGLLEGKRFTCFPGFEASVSGASFKLDPVVVDGKLITSRAPGTAAAFSLEIINQLHGPEISRKIAEATLQPQF